MKIKEGACPDFGGLIHRNTSGYMALGARAIARELYINPMSACCIWPSVDGATVNQCQIFDSFNCELYWYVKEHLLCDIDVNPRS